MRQKKDERLLNSFNKNKPSQAHVEKLMDKAISTLSRLDTHYGNLPVSKKRELISSIFLEKIVFDGENYRTPKVNEAARLIYMINSDLYSKKTGKDTNLHTFPVKWSRRESNSGPNR